MSAYLICIITESGIPLFARKLEAGTGMPPVPFPIASVLNGIRVFGSEHGAHLLKTVTGNSRIIWRELGFKYTFILTTQDECNTDLHYRNFLENVYDLMVLHVGTEALLDTSNRESLKTKVKRAYPAIDVLMAGLGTLDPSELHIGDLVQGPDRMCFTSEQPNYQMWLNQFIEKLGLGYGCISCDQALVVATRSWWSLRPNENYLLMLISYLVAHRLTEWRVYLPQCSPSVPFVLVIIRMDTIRLTLLCGSQDSLHKVKEAAQELRERVPPIFDRIEADRKTGGDARKFFTLCKDLVGFMVVNVRTASAGAFVLSETKPDRIKMASRIDQLRTFYRNTVNTIFPWRIAGEVDKEGFNPDATQRVLETYWCSEYHMCHAARCSTLQVFALYDKRALNSDIRKSTKDLFLELYKDKNFY